jgi:fructose 5-dehydrogenase small subunit
MSVPEAPRPPSVRRTISRRTLLSTTAMLAGGTWLGRVGLWWPPRHATAQAGLTAFMAVSRRLTGKDDLELAVGARLHAALLRTNPEPPRAVASLDAWLAANDAASGPALAQTPEPERETGQRILRGWYLGVVGDENAAECVAFETILAYRPVADQVVMQTFCREAPGYWAERPSAVQPSAA